MTHDRGHGRDEVRKVEIISIDPSSSVTRGFNGVRQIIKITRQNTDHLTFETKDHVVYAICSQSCKKLKVTAVAQAIRAHWSIEVRLHGQRDVRMGEDANKTIIGSAPRALACLRNWAIAIVEKYQRLNCMRRISHAWQSLSYNTEKGLSQLEVMI